jgi:hypothetical protein
MSFFLIGSSGALCRKGPDNALKRHRTMELLMSTATRTFVLRMHAGYLLVASFTAFFMDVAASFFGIGPEAVLIAAAPHTGIGFIEAHGLAFILGLLLWRAAPERAWHLTGAAIGLLLGTCNLLFWDMFAAADSMAMGYVTTGLHWCFAVLQLASLPALRNMPDAGVATLGHPALREHGGR